MGASLLECILSSLCLSVLIITSARISTEDSECCQYIALDSDNLLYLKEQMEAEEDAERLRRRTEKKHLQLSKYPSQLIISILDNCSSFFGAVM